MKRYRDKAILQYESMLAFTQADIPGGRNAVMRYYRRNLLPHLPVASDSSILDLGCGSGLFLEFLMQQGIESSRGVDICEEHIRSCREIGVSATLEDNLSFLQRHAESFDCIVMNHVLEHFDKDEGLDLLEAVFASLRPGGRVIVVCPNMGNPFTAGRGRYADFTHETGYTGESLQFMLQIAGGEQVSLHGNRYILPFESYRQCSREAGLGASFAVFTPHISSQRGSEDDGPHKEHAGPGEETIELKM